MMDIYLAGGKKKVERKEKGKKRPDSRLSLSLYDDAESDLLSTNPAD